MQSISTTCAAHPHINTEQKKYVTNSGVRRPAFGEAWERRIGAEFDAGNLTRAYRDVMRALPTFRAMGGDLFPSHEAIGKRAQCSTRTVGRALAIGRDLGLVHWMPRRKRVGWRSLPTSNRYFLNVPRPPVVSGLRPPFPRRHTGGQTGGIKVQGRKKEALKGVCADAKAVGRDLLAERRATMEARFQGIAQQRR
jgi:hypothetical protein